MKHMGLMLGLLILVYGCSSSETSKDTGQVQTDALPDAEVAGEVPLPTGNSSITAKVRLIKDMKLQVVDLLRQYLTNDTFFKGDLYLDVCQDADCNSIVTTKKVLEDYLFSTGFPKEVSASELPSGKFYLRFFLDTKYSKDYKADFDTTKGLSPLDIVQIKDPNVKVTSGNNPERGTIEVELVDNETRDLGEITLGHIIFDDPSFPPKGEDGYLLVAASGTDVFRNQIKVVDLEKFEVLEPIVVKKDGKAFEGDICGFVKGQDKYLYVIGVGKEGAYVFYFDTKTRMFGSADPVLIPHPDYKGGDTSNLDPERYPWPCRGVYIKKDTKEFLYLIAFKGAGALTNSKPYPLVVVDVTGMGGGAKGNVVEKYDQSVDPFFDTSRIIRGAATDGNKLYLLEASWSKLVDKNTVYVFNVGDSGKVTKEKQWDSGTAEDKCDSTNNWVPAITVVQWGGQKYVLVGNDDDISIYTLEGTQVSQIDTTNYGRLITSFALSPDGQTLYAMPNCKSSKKKASVAAGVNNKRIDLDRHGIVEIALTSDPQSPTLLHSDRDFDEDNTPDGGIDLEFLYLKANLLRWCETCSGVVPPTAYTGPEIAAGKSNVFMRGTGIQSQEKNSSGLGQVADLGVYDLQSGRGVMFRNYQIWLDGPSSRWGFDLNPANPVKDYSDDVSTAGIIWIQK